MHHYIGQTRTVSDARGPRALYKRVPSPFLIDMVLELVHPSNLGPLPPSPDALIAKAIQIGLATSLENATTEVLVWCAALSSEEDAELQARQKRIYHCI
jgi:hypothetical protein